MVPLSSSHCKYCIFKYKNLMVLMAQEGLWRIKRLTPSIFTVQYISEINEYIVIKHFPNRAAVSLIKTFKVFSYNVLKRKVSKKWLNWLKHFLSDISCPLRRIFALRSMYLQALQKKVSMMRKKIENLIVMRKKIGKIL